MASASGVKGLSAPPQNAPGPGGTRPAPNINKTQLGLQEIAFIARQCDWNVPLAVAVAMAESGGNTHAENYCCVGLWQINVLAHPQYTREQMKDPTANVIAACQIYHSAGKSWNPWESFTNGSYKQFLDKAKKATESTGFGSSNVEGGIGAVVPGVGALNDWGKALGKALAFLFSTAGWITILKVIGGAVLLLIAIKELL